jgi:hypothetical protein
VNDKYTFQRVRRSGICLRKKHVRRSLPCVLLPIRFMGFRICLRKLS